jgi:4-hydroxy-2-oxoheptanedioate aldolase
MNADSLPRRVRKGEPVLGSFLIEFPVRAVPECLALAGFDFAILDLEHGATDMHLLSLLVSACRDAGLGVVIRAHAGARGELTRILDMQPDGVMLPAVKSATECLEIVELTQYPPLGHRGLAPIARHGSVRGRQQRVHEERPLVIVQIEGAEAVNAASEIASVPGVDAVFVGPYDLSQSLGVAGNLRHPDVLRLGEEVALSLSGEVRLGVYVEGAEQAALWHGLGATMLAVETDSLIFLKACRDLSSRVRAQLTVDPAEVIA